MILRFTAATAFTLHRDLRVTSALARARARKSDATVRIQCTARFVLRNLMKWLYFAVIAPSLQFCAINCITALYIERDTRVADI